MDNKKNINNKKISRIGIVLFFLILIGIVLGVTYAFWTWNSSVNKSVVFSTPDIEKYIIYDEGDSKFIGNFQPVNTFCESANNTLSFYKKSEATNVKFTATIKMDINSIGKNIALSDDVYWVVTSGNNTIDCSDGLDSDGVLAYGTFNGVENGQNLDLLSNIDVTLEQQTFTTWIWIDNSGENLSKLSGETIDTNVWTFITMNEGKGIVTFDLNGGEFESVEYTDVGEHEFAVPYDGEYKLEVWGAQGGNVDSTYIGGYGGYSMGLIELDKDDVLYVNVGGKGEDRCNYQYCLGGYNGGGRGAGSTSTSSELNSSGGGGATHISLKAGVLSSLSDDKESILIVGGGGGGTSYEAPSYTGIGGSGGGISGNNGTNLTSEWLYGSGGTQTVGGVSGGGKLVDNTNRGNNGSFGLGGDGNYYSGGGGGGYYGGGASNQAGAGGGSGYIGNDLLTDKAMYCYNCESSGDVSTLTYSTTNVSDTAISNYAKSGDGAVRITVDSISKKVFYSKKYGSLPIPKKDGLEFVGWTTVKDDYSSLVTSDSIVGISGSHTLYALFSPIYKVTFDLNGGKLDTPYETINYTTVGEHEFIVPYDGEYKLEVWGAQGADATTTYIGGYGGYSVGNINLTEGDILYVNVGGAGGSYTYKTNTAQTANGGYNGGGFGHTNSTTWSLRNLFAGGGATHIAKESGLLSKFESSMDSVLIVAGGGGAGISQYDGTSSTSYKVHAKGGSGGGFEGGDLQLIENYWTCGAQDSTKFYSKGGTQNSCSVRLLCDTYLYFSDYGCGFGQAAYDSNSITSDTASWGGGGGLYGGGYGSGGSGYIGNSLLTDKAMYCYNCNTSDDASTLTYTTTNVSDSAISNYAKKGNGAARVTFYTSTKNVVYYKKYGDLPIPTRNFSTFVGWNTKSDGTGEYIKSDTRVMKDSEHTLYAIWEPWEFNVSYSVNGGNIDSTTVSSDGNTTYNWSTSNDIISLDGNFNFHSVDNLNNINLYDYNDINYMNISKSGYGVAKKSEWICLEGCKIDNGIYDQNVQYKYSDFCDENSESCNVVLGVNWRNIYTISYDANGGSDAPPSQEKLYGVTVYVSDIVPVNEGAIFLGWSTSPTATTPSYSGGSEITINDNITLYAVWTQSPVYSYSCANGSAGESPYLLTYSGNCTVIDDGNGDWRIKLLSTGSKTLTFVASMQIDAFLVGGGGGGGGCCSGNEKYGGDGGSTTAFGKTANGGKGARDSDYGGHGGSGGGWTGQNGGSDGSDGGDGGYSGRGGTGQGKTTREFGESTGTLYAGGGGGGYYDDYSPGAGGAGGGGAGRYNGTANTGGGGGGSKEGGSGGSGGSGIVIIRNAR